MSNEITNHENEVAPASKGRNWLAVVLIAIGGLLLVVNLAAMTVGRIAYRIADTFDDAIVIRGIDVDGSEFVIEDFDQVVEADIARMEARIDAQADRIESQVEAEAARIEAEAARIEAEAARIEQHIDRIVAPAAPRVILRPFGPRFNRGPNLWGAAFLLLGLYFITRSRQRTQAAPATGPDADPPAAA